MRLQAYLDEENLSYREFARKKDPPKSYSTIRQWALGLRFPQDPDDIAWLTRVTDGRVTANDITEHVREVRSAAAAAGLSPTAYVSERLRAAA